MSSAPREVSLDDIFEMRILNILNLLSNPVLLGCVAVISFHFLGWTGAAVALGTCIVVGWAKTFLKEWMKQQHEAMSPHQLADFAEEQLKASWRQVEPHLAAAYFCTKQEDRKSAWVKAFESAVDVFSDRFSMTLADLYALMPEFGPKGQTHFTSTADAFETLVHRMMKMTQQQSTDLVWNRYATQEKACSRVKLVYRGHNIRMSIMKRAQPKDEPTNACIVEMFGVARRMFCSLALHEYILYLNKAVTDRDTQEAAIQSLLRQRG